MSEPMVSEINKTNSERARTHAIDVSALDRRPQVLDIDTEATAMSVSDLSLYYGAKQALFDIRLTIPKQRVTAFIGPSGCGKSTLLRCFNRMNDLVEDCRISGQVRLDDSNIYDKNVEVAELRRRVGMVFQNPTLFLKAFTRMSLMAYAFKAYPKNAFWMIRWNGHLKERRSGKR